MDYICLPFPVPTPCNLTELLLRHYGDDVVYKDCWEYETQEWDTEFVNEYKHTTFTENKQGAKGKSRKRKKRGDVDAAQEYWNALRLREQRMQKKHKRQARPKKG